MNNAQEFIERNRPPRVHIKTGVEGDDEQERVEIPFVIGVMASLSGKSITESKELADRRFVNCNSEKDLDKMMKPMAPRVAFEVENTTGEGDSKLEVDLTFSSLKDFSPENVASKVKGLKEIFELRNALANFKAHTGHKRKIVKWLDEALAQVRKEAVASAFGDLAGK